MIKNKEVLIGETGVDSGQLLIIDPCYIDSYWKKSEKGKGKSGGGSYKDCCNVTLKEKRAGEVKSIQGVVSESGYGDGEYPVYATYNSEGRIIRLRIEFNE